MSKLNKKEPLYNNISEVNYMLANSLQSVLLQSLSHTEGYISTYIKLIEWTGRSYLMMRLYTCTYKNLTGEIISQKYYTKKEPIFLCIGGKYNLQKLDSLMILVINLQSKDGAYRLLKFSKNVKLKNSGRKRAYVWISKEYID